MTKREIEAALHEAQDQRLRDSCKRIEARWEGEQPQRVAEAGYSSDKRWEDMTMSERAVRAREVVGASMIEMDKRKSPPSLAMRVGLITYCVVMAVMVIDYFWGWTQIVNQMNLPY